MTQAEIQARLDALHEEAAGLRRAGAIYDAYGADALNTVAHASAEARAKRLKEIREEIEAIGPADAPPPPLINASVELDRSSATIQSLVTGQVVVTNHGPDAVEVVALCVHADPPARISDWAPPPGRPLKVPPGESKGISFSVVAMRPGTYTLGAVVRLGSGAQIDAVLDALLVLSPV